MLNRAKRLKIILIFILFVDTCLIKYGTCAPRISQLVNSNPQKVKRSAGFMNYLSSIICSRTSFNYPDSSWNFFEPSPPLPTPVPSYEANFQYQYLDDSGNKDQDENHINWPEHDVKKINYFETVPNDVPIILPNLGKDDSYTYILENDCDGDRNNVDNDFNWDIPQQGIDESMFHNFFLIPAERDFNQNSYPTRTTTTTTEKPIEQPIQNRNECEEEKTPNITIFNCYSNPNQKEFLEKVLSDNNDEYLVLLIKRNAFLRPREQENKSEIVLQSPPNTEALWKNTTSSVVEIQEDVVLEQNKSNGNTETTKTLHKVENKITETIGQDLKIFPKQESSTEIPTKTIPTYTSTQEEAVTVQLNKSKTTKEASNITTENVDKSTDRTELDMDFKDISTTGSSISIATSTVSTPIAMQEQVVKLSKISIKEENENNFANDSQRESIIQIPNEDSTDIQNLQIVENKINAETVEKPKTLKNISEYTLNVSEKPDNDLDTGSVKENKVHSVLETTEVTLNTNSEAKKDILVENLEEPQNLESVNNITSVISTNDAEISNVVPTLIIPSEIENFPLQTEEISEGNLNLTIQNNLNVQVNSERSGLLEDSIASVNSNYLQSNEDQEIFLKQVEVSSTEGTTNIEEDLILQVKSEDTNLDSISGTTTNSVDNLESIPSELT